LTLERHTQATSQQPNDFCFHEAHVT